MSIIRKYRLRHKLTQKQLAAMLGCTQAQISHIENGRRSITLANARTWEKLPDFHLTKSQMRPDIYQEK